MLIHVDKSGSIKNMGKYIIEIHVSHISDVYSYHIRLTLNAHKPSATLDPQIPTWSIMSPNNHLSFSKPYMLSVHEAKKILYSYHLRCQGSRNCQKSDVSNHSFVDMVRLPFQYCSSV